MGILAAASELLELSTKLHKLIPPRTGEVDRTMELREERFRRVLRFARDNSPFYWERLRGIDVDTCALADLPTLTKPQMMANTALSLLNEHNVSALIVVDNERPVGLVHFHDLLRIGVA